MERGLSATFVAFLKAQSHEQRVWIEYRALAATERQVQEAVAATNAAQGAHLNAIAEAQR